MGGSIGIIQGFARKMEEACDQSRGETPGIPREEKPIKVGINREIGTSFGKLALEVDGTEVEN